MTPSPTGHLLATCKQWLGSLGSLTQSQHVARHHQLLDALARRTAAPGVTLELDATPSTSLDKLLAPYTFDPDERRQDAVTPAVLADVYERFLDPRDGAKMRRSARGVFFTPTALIDRMCKEALEFSPQVADETAPAACDPSCGAGSFLVRLALMAPGLSLTGFELDPVASALAQFRLACVRECSSGQAAGKVDILVGDAFQLHNSFSNRFSLVIGNPPYVRAEKVTDKVALQTLCLEMAAPLSGRSDLYAYFFPLARRLLRLGGVACFVTSDSWLDSQAGEGLQSWLTDRHDRVAIRATRDRASFDQAGVTSAVTLFLRPKDMGDSSCQVTFHHSTSGHEDEKGRTVACPSPGKWGARYLRLPLPLSEIACDQKRTSPLSALCSLHYGTKPGISEFFVLEADDTRGIESPFLRPILTSTREISTLSIQPQSLPKRLFACDLPLKQLAREGPGAATYVLGSLKRRTQAGAAHTKPGVLWPLARSVRNNRPEWYCLTARPGADFVIPCLLGQRLFAARTTKEMAASNTFFHVTVPGSHSVGFWGGLLNCSWTLLMMEVFGRAKGLGGLNLYGHDLKQLPIPRPTLFSSRQAQALERAFAQVCQRPIRTIAQELASPDRQALDAIVFDALHLPPPLRSTACDTLLALASARHRHGTPPALPPFSLGPRPKRST